MLQSTFSNEKLHVAIIMDGNGRWALARGLPRTAGHRAGAEAVRRTIEAALRLRVGTLTLYAFSSDNWRRPRQEVATLMKLFRDHLNAETEKCIEHGVRLSVIGRRDRLPAELIEAIQKAETATRYLNRLHLRIAVDYSARDAILLAAMRINGRAPSREEFSRLLGEAYHADEPAQDVDLLIRTGGEQRLSDFLLWECAYAEFYFTNKLWPDFEAGDFEAALKEFHSRQRRFGRV
jgi:undecaprenyl diphosphate synthase